MEITHDQTVSLLLSMAAEMGQAAAAASITEHYHALGGGNLPLVVGNVWNNQQNIFHRWIEGRTQMQREKVRELIPAIRAAMRAEQGKRTDIQSRVATANRECIEATNAALTGQPSAFVRKEAFEAIDALAQLAGLVVHVAPERHAA